MTMLKAFTTIVLVLALFVVCQYYVFVSQGPFDSFLNSLKMVTPPISFPRKDPKRSGPLHVLVLSYARTGSSFLGDLLQSYPEVFYHYEPLHFLGNTVKDSDFPEGRLLLRKLFLCQATLVPDYMRWLKMKKSFAKLRRNVRYWDACNSTRSCFNPKFMEGYCSNHSVRLIKTIRMTLTEAVKMYHEFPDLNLKIIYLVRDPRAVLNSRLKRPIKNWCIRDPICFFPKNFCKLLAEDLKLACTLIVKQQDFMILRYEDLALDPYNTSRTLAKFLDYGQASEMTAFLKTHTMTTVPRSKVINGISYSYQTYRDSMVAATKWRTEMIYKLVMIIQRDCSGIIEALGYHLYRSEPMLRSNMLLDRDFDTSVDESCDAQT